MTRETEKTFEGSGDDSGLGGEPVGKPVREDDFPSSSSLALHSTSTCTKCTITATATVESLAEASAATPTSANATTSNAVSGTMSGRVSEAGYCAGLAILILACFLPMLAG